jgi:hypothetical protein
MKTMNFLDIGSGAGVPIMHASIYFQKVAAIEIQGNLYQLMMKTVSKLKIENTLPMLQGNITDVNSLEGTFGDIHIVYDFGIGMDADARMHVRTLITDSTKVQFVCTFRQKTLDPMNLQIGDPESNFELISTVANLRIHRSTHCHSCYIFKRRINGRLL